MDDTVGLLSVVRIRWIKLTERLSHNPLRMEVPLGWSEDLIAGNVQPIDFNAMDQLPASCLSSAEAKTRL